MSANSPLSQLTPHRASSSRSGRDAQPTQGFEKSLAQGPRRLSRESLLAPPQDAFQSAETPSSSGGWSWGKTALVVIGAGGALAGCTQAPPVQPIQATTPMTLENPQLMVLPEGVPRIDLHRSTTTTTSTDMNGNLTSHESDDPYKEVGTYMGGGIFLDTNDNLVFVPQLALGESVGLTDFQRVSLGRENASRWFSPPILTRQDDGTVSATRSSVDRIESNGSSLTQLNGRHQRRQAVRTPNGMELRDWNRTKYEIRQNGNGLEVYRYGHKSHTLTRQDGVIHLQRYHQRPYVITQQGPTITLDRGYGKPEVITKTEQGFQVQHYRDYSLHYGKGEISSSYRGHTPIQYQ